jgi:[ribosomal protein S5]-alanine N-acetyltransferase
MTRTRLVRLSDAPALSELLGRNREFLAPSSPIRPEEFFSVDGQRAGIQAALAEHQRGTKLPHVILTEDGQIAGRITLNEIVRGPFQSCHMGYWVAAEHNGRGLATGAVREIIRVAFEELGLHRIEAGTLLHNVRSQRVLEHNGFARFGVAPAYLNIAGRWQDHAMYQVVNGSAEGRLSSG